MFGGNPFGAGWFGQAYENVSAAAADTATGNGCDVVLEDGSLIVLEDGTSALLRETCVDVSTSGGNRLFGPPRRTIVPAPLVDHRVYKVRPARIRVYASAATTTVEHDASPAHITATACTPQTRFRYQAPIADGVLVARAVPAPSRVDTDKAFADLVRDVYMASNA